MRVLLDIPIVSRRWLESGGMKIDYPGQWVMAVSPELFKLLKHRKAGDSVLSIRQLRALNEELREGLEAETTGYLKGHL